MAAGPAGKASGSPPKPRPKLRPKPKPRLRPPGTRPNSRPAKSAPPPPSGSQRARGPQVAGEPGRNPPGPSPLGVVGPVVLRQHVVAEIVRRVPPGRVDVGAVSLR